MTGELAVDYALRGNEGIRFEDGTAFTDVAEAGGRITYEVDTITELPAWVDIASFSCEILAITEF